jgi:hypothetical protein
MAIKYKIFWNKEKQEVHDAFLFNCRDDDLRAGASIPVGAIVLGAVGCVAAERPVRGLTGTILPFQPTRRCEWRGQELRCQVHPDVPAAAKLKAELRLFNYIVAELTSADQVALAQNVGVPVITTPTGKNLVNLECACFQKQGIKNPRRAKMI